MKRPSFLGDLPGKLPGNQQGEGGIKDFADLREKSSAWTIGGPNTSRASRRRRWTRPSTARGGPATRSSASPAVAATLAARLHPRALYNCPSGQHAATLRRRKLPQVMLIAMAMMEAG